MIALQGLSLWQLGRTSDAAPILKDCQLKLAAGEFCLLRGDSGSGKSTLLRLLAGVLDLSYEGDIFLAGCNLREVVGCQKAQLAGLLMQNPSRQFAMGSLRRELIFALENVQTPPSKIAEKMQQACQLADTIALMDQPFHQLSGGEKQRCALTVLLALDSPILLLDEPFASIDPASRRRLLQLLAQLRDLGKTILLADHDLAGYQEVVDRHLLLAEGHLQELPVADLPDHEPQWSLAMASGCEDAASLQLQQVSYGFEKGRPLLQPSDFTFQTGLTTLTGANGSGKSTLLRTIMQLEKYRGRYLYEGRPLPKRRSLYRRVSLGVQDPQHQFTGLTVREELVSWGWQADQLTAEQEASLQKLGLGEFLDRSIYHLSEGQKKMVQLLGILSRPWELLLLDEPFASLDQRGCDFFADVLAKKSQQEAVLVVSHRMQPLAQISRHHVHLAAGQLQDLKKESRK